MHRLFVAFALPPPLRDALLDRFESIPGLRWQSAEQLHLTIRFLGEVARPLAEDIAHALGAVRPPPLAIALSGLGQFDTRGGGVLWAGVTPRPPLQALAAKVERACQAAGAAPERRSFHPHVTLARWTGRKPDLDGWIARHAGLSSPLSPLGALTLFESHLTRSGAHYEAIASWPAQGEPR
jgi:2'-5' RNA ligase